VAGRRVRPGTAQTGYGREPSSRSLGVGGADLGAVYKVKVKVM